MRPDPREDDELVAAANRGEVAAFETLYRRHRAYVWRVAFRVLRHGPDAEEIAQETFLRWFDQFPGFELTAAVTTYLHTIARRLALNAARQRARPADAAGPLNHTADRPARVATDRETEALERLLGGLNEDHREVVLMRYVDSLHLDDMAAVLGIPVGTVKSRLHAAVDALRRDPRTTAYFGLTPST